MARQKIDFGLGSFAMLVHGPTNSGKTRLAGDMLRAEAKQGLVRYLNVRGEDGALSLAGALPVETLAEITETVETWEDLDSALKDFQKLNLRALVVDSAKWYFRLVQTKVTKTERLPSTGNNSNEWGMIHFEFEKEVKRTRSVAPIVLFVSPSDKSTNQLTGDMSITPDLPGRQAAGVAGFFDFCFYLEAEALNEIKTKRTLVCGPVRGITTRARVAGKLPVRLDLPGEGPGAWERIMAAIRTAHNATPEMKEAA